MRFSLLTGLFVRRSVDGVRTSEGDRTANSAADEDIPDSTEETSGIVYQSYHLLLYPP